MGICLSRDDEDEHIHLQGLPPTGDHKPLRKRSSFSWNSDKPITRRELVKKRNTFWETQPLYFGKPEIWSALRGACEASNHELAQTILDSVNITLPTGSLVDGCYDSLGNHYIVPVYCIVEPENLVEDGSGGSWEYGGGVVQGQPGGMSKPSTDNANNNTSTKSKSRTTTVESTNGEITDEDLIQGEAMDIILRVSSSQKDYKIRVGNQTTFALLKKWVMVKEGFERKSNVKIRFLFLGKILEEKMGVGEVDKLVEGGIVQVMVSALS